MANRSTTEKSKVHSVKSDKPFDGALKPTYSIRITNDPILNRRTKTSGESNFHYELVDSQNNVPASTFVDSDSHFNAIYEMHKEKNFIERIQLIKLQSPFGLTKASSVFASNLSKLTTEACLKEKFSQFGYVYKIRIEKSAFTAMSTGLAIIQFLDRDDFLALDSAKVATDKLNNTLINDVYVKVEFDPKKKKFKKAVFKFHQNEKINIHLTHPEFFEKYDENSNHSTESKHYFSDESQQSKEEINEFWYNIDYVFSKNTLYCKDKASMKHILYPFKPDKIIHRKDRFICQFKSYDECRKCYFGINRSSFEEGIVFLDFKYSEEDKLTMRKNLEHMRLGKEENKEATVVDPTFEKLRQIALEYTQNQNGRDLTFTNEPKKSNGFSENIFVEPGHTKVNKIPESGSVEKAPEPLIVKRSNANSQIQNSPLRNNYKNVSNIKIIKRKTKLAINSESDAETYSNTDESEKEIVTEKFQDRKRSFPVNPKVNEDEQEDFFDSIGGTSSKNCVLRKVYQKTKQNFSFSGIRIIGDSSALNNFNKFFTKFTNLSEEVPSPIRYTLKEQKKELMKNSLQSRQKKTVVAESGIHGTGLYLMEKAKKHELIIEYIGEIIGNQVADNREAYYQSKGINSSYMFRLSENQVIDSTFIGNRARFINHSCNPNCYTRKIEINGVKRIAIYSYKFIPPRSEITYDYQFAIDEDPKKKILCLCNAPNCKKYLN